MDICKYADDIAIHTCDKNVRDITHRLEHDCSLVEIGVLAGNRSFTKKQRTRIATINIFVLFHSKFDKFDNSKLGKVRQFQVRQIDNSKLDN